MSILIITVIGLLSIFLGKHYFGRWFNHVTFYALIWTLMLSFFELRLIRYIDLSLKTWLVISGAYIAFILGVVTIFFGRDLFQKPNLIKITPPPSSSLFNNNARPLGYLIIFLSIIGILSALQHWKVLFDEYGNLANIVLEAFKIYRTRTEGDLEGVIPYVWLTIHAGVVLAGLYTAYKKRITLIALLPIFALLLKEIANFSRAGILLGFIEYFVSFMLMRHLLSSQINQKHKVSRTSIVFTIIIVFGLMVLSASVVRYLRHPIDEMKGSTSELSTFKGGFFLSPGIYLYASSHVGVLEKHLDEEAQARLIGNKTISPIYRFLGGFKLVPKPEYHQKGYFIPQWTNTGTYLRDIHGDFSYWGVFLIPFLLGLLSTTYWFKFYETGLLKYYFALTYLYLIIGMSFLFMVTSHPAWLIVFFTIMFSLPILEKLGNWLSPNN